MVPTFNGWDELPEAEREELDRWEESMRWLSREPRLSGSLPLLDGANFDAHF